MKRGCACTKSAVLVARIQRASAKQARRARANSGWSFHVALRPRCPGGSWREIYSEATSAAAFRAQLALDLDAFFLLILCNGILPLMRALYACMTPPFKHLRLPSQPAASNRRPAAQQEQAPKLQAAKSRALLSQPCVACFRVLIHHATPAARRKPRAAAMTEKRAAAGADRAGRPAKRLRAALGAPVSVSPSGPATPARPPRMPQFRHSAQDWRLVRHLNQLCPRELLVLVRTVERRYRKLAEFEAAEIRRAQALGLARAQGPLVAL